MKLNQVIAVEKGIKGKAQAEVDAIYKAAQKPALFEGGTKVYKKKADDDEDVPGTKQIVQMKAADALFDIAARWRALFDVTAQKDYANCVAKANVVVDGVAVLEQVPVTYLLFLEKQLTELYTIVGKFPTLDLAEQWQWDPANSTYFTEPVLTTRTKKVNKPIVLYPATDKHPAQTQLVVEDASVGTWETRRFSGAMPQDDRRKLMDKIERLQHAVKSAREAANTVDAPTQEVGQKIFGWIFQP